MRKILLTIVVSLVATIALAQNNYQDVVYLKNGSIIRGIIIEQVPNESLKIETADRSVFAFRIDEVEKMTRERIETTMPLYEESLNYDYVGGRKWFVSFGGGANLIGDVSFGIGKFELGYYVNPKNLLSIEFSGGSYRENEIGWFHWEERGTGKLHTNGKIHYDYNSSLFFVSWSHIKDLSDKFQWRIGPTLGVLSISGGLAYEPIYVEGLPGTQSVTESAFAFGANTGFMWNFSRNQRWFLDLGYKLYGNTGIRFDERTIRLGSDRLDLDKKTFSTISNQITLSVGWRFGKAY